MKNLKNFRRTGALLLACAVLFLCSASAYLEASGQQADTAESQMTEGGANGQAFEAEDPAGTEVANPAGTGAESTAGTGAEETGSLETENEAVFGTENPAGTRTESPAGAEAEDPAGTKVESPAASGTEAENTAGAESGAETESTAGTEAAETGSPETGSETVPGSGAAADTEGTETVAGIEADTGEAETVAGAAADTGETETVAGIEADTGEAETVAGTAADTGETETVAGAAADTGETETVAGAAADTADTGEAETVAGAAADTADTGEAETVAEAEADTEEAETGTEAETETETELTLEDVLKEAERQNIDFFGLAPGESLTFYTSVEQGDGIMTVAVTAVTVTRAAVPYLYADYGYGSYQTYPYTVSFNDITATAYCIQPSLDPPGSSRNYTVTKLKGAKMLAKVCYYGTKAAGEEGFFAERHPSFSAGQRFIITHIAAAYANGSPDAFSGANSTSQALAMELYEYCAAQPDIPDVDMEFSDADVTAYVEGDIQRTKEIAFRADTLQSVTFKLPDGVKLHNVTTGETSRAGADVEIHGGMTFYLEAPLTQAADVAPVWSKTMKGTVTKDYSAYKITTGSNTQNLALVFGEGVDDEKYIDFSVKWVQKAALEIRKTDSKTKRALGGAVFGVYADQDCTELLKKMPKTDAEGQSDTELNLAQGTVYLREITAPEGYTLSTKVYPVALTAGEKKTVTVPNAEKLGSLTVCKEGEVLVGASVKTGGTTFKYEARRLKGAVYNVYAGADIVAADGQTVYEKGALVAEGLTTGQDGSVTLKNLHFGSYKVKEMKAPSGFYNGQSAKTVTVSGTDSNPTAEFETKFRNERQKAVVSLQKADKAGTPLQGAVFGLYTGARVTDADGSVAAEKDTLIEKVTTNAQGTAKFTADLPAGFQYYIKELQAPAGYLLGEESTFKFAFSGADDSKESVSFTHAFENEKPKGRLTIYKEGEVLAGAAVTQSGTSFRYEIRRLPGAVYNVYAGETITADGKVIYQKGALVAEGVVTGQDGSATLNSLYYGKYQVKEMRAPAGYFNARETRTVTVSETADHPSASFQTGFRNERQKAGLRVKKTDKGGAALASGVFGLYADAQIVNVDGAVIVPKGSLIEQVTTDAQGSAGFTADLPVGFAYCVREIQAPDGYLLNQGEAYVFTFSGADDSVQTVDYSHTFEDEEPRGRLTVYKEGEVLTGAAVTEDGVAFQYGMRRQKGAVFNVYAGEDIRNGAGQLLYGKGTLIAENLTTGEDGSAVLGDLFLGTYAVTEVHAPQNYVCRGETRTVTLSYGGQMESLVFSETTFQNERQRAQVTVRKEDSETKKPLAGGVYGLFAGNDIVNADGAVIVGRDTLIERMTTGADGCASGKADLPLGCSYYVRELRAPDKYVRNGEEVFSFTFSYTNDREACTAFSHTFENDRVKAKIRLIKRDSEKGSAQGDATLEHAVYGLYAREDIVHPDGATGVLFRAGEQVAALTTDQKGEAEVGELYLGSYYIRELSPSNGYLLDPAEYDIVCGFADDLTALVEKECVSAETVIRQPFQIIKIADNGKTDADYLEGAGFTAYLESSLRKDADGAYDFTSAEPVVLGPGGEREMFTDKTGYAVSVPLPFGTYIVRETTVPAGYTPVMDFVVRITENRPDQPQPWRVLLDEEFEAKLKIIKNDDETQKAVLEADTEFRVFDKDAEEYVEQVTTYPTKVTHRSYFTDAEGYLILPQSLPMGHYRIEEVTAPDGYTLGENSIEVDVDSDAAYQMDSNTGDAIIETVAANHPVKGELRILKKGEALKGYEDDFSYELRPLAGAVFEVRAAEDIYTADYQEDSEGKRVLEYVKDALVAELVTDADGTAVLTDLPLGRYQIKEKTAPEGYVLNEDAQTVQFAYVDQDTPVVVENAEFIDERQRAEISAVKKDAENGEPLAGAEFGLYAKADIAADGETIVSAGTLLAKAVTGQDGRAVFDRDVPFGEYFIRELTAPEGYVLSEGQTDIVFSYQGQDAGVIRFEESFLDEPTEVEITKTDIATGEELDGAVLSILDEKGEVIDSWTSEREKPHTTKRLHVGETYRLREEFAPYGYLRAEEVRFTVTGDGNVQKVEMQDRVPVGQITISKTGEFVGRVTWNEMVAGAIESVFGYVTGSLEAVTFEVYAAEDIRAADGVSADHYKKDELVATVRTDALGYARTDYLPLGRYYVAERSTAEGFVLDEETREIDLSYRDQDTPIVTYDTEWQNSRQKARVSVLKKAKDTGNVLAGGVFALCAKEDIAGADGGIIIKADAVIEQKTTGEDGRLLFAADLPVGHAYYVTEVKAPDGYVTTGERQEFVFEYAGEQTSEVTYEFLFEDEPTTVEISKSDITTGEELPGAKLQVNGQDGSLADEWISGEEPHRIRGLVVGESYTLTEQIPADGYVTAESIVFTVENTAEPQRVEMADDVTKVEISKTDLTDGSPEVEGAKLSILDEDGQVLESWVSGEEPHYIEKLPIGRYRLIEESAPKGYLISEEVEFEVEDTGEIQSVEMVDGCAEGRVVLDKTDSETGKPMKGVEFELRDGRGRVLETLVTDASGHAESELYPIALFEEGRYQEELVYTLQESRTLEGYRLDETEHEIRFEYEDDRTPEVECRLELSNEKLPEPAVQAPQTADRTRLLPGISAMLLSAGTAAVLALWKKRKKILS